MPYQYESLSRKRPRHGYSDIITAEAPLARANYFNQQELGLQQEELDEQKQQFEKDLEFRRHQQEVYESLARKEQETRQAQAYSAKKESTQQKRMAGAATGAQVGTYVAPGIGTVIGGVVGYIAGNWSHVCTAIFAELPGLMSEADMKLMSKLRRWTEKEHPQWTAFYDLAAPVALANLYEHHGVSQFRDELKNIHDEISKTVQKYISNNDMVNAFDEYQRIVLPFITENAPEYSWNAFLASEKELEIQDGS